MKTLEELKAIREKMQSQVSMRAEDHAPCGGRYGYLRNRQRRQTGSNTLSTLVQENDMTTVFRYTDRLHRLCQYEPIVEILEPGKEKSHLYQMNAEKAEEVYKAHLIGGHILKNYTLQDLNKEETRCIVHMY